MSRPVVVGGGFAGMAAACRLADAGHRPIVFERTPRLGGRAASFVDRTTNETLDDGVHVLMRCCEASLGFLQRIRVSDLLLLQDRLSIPVRFPGGETMLRSAPLPGPLHLFPSLLTYRPLTLRQRLSAGHAALCLRFARHVNEYCVTSLERYGQSAAAMERLWNPISVAALNAPIDAVDAASMKKVLDRAFLRPDGADMGFFRVPLATVFDRAKAYTEARGGTVHTGRVVRRLVFDEAGAVTGVETGRGKAVTASVVILAIPPQDSAHLFPDDRFTPTALTDAAKRLIWSPIANVHLWFDRPVLRGGFSMAVASPVQGIFDVDWLRGRAPTVAAGSGQHLVLSQSAVSSWSGLSVGEIVGRMNRALADLLPETRDAQCVRSLVVTRPRATFVPSPGHNRWRLGPTIGVDGLLLAGDWTATGWPSTIESAVRSGITAAARAERLLELLENAEEGDNG